jgi:hypothetical protein
LLPGGCIGQPDANGVILNALDSLGLRRALYHQCIEELCGLGRGDLTRFYQGKDAVALID